MWYERLTIGKLIDQAAVRWPEREAICFEARRWSYSDFRGEVDNAAKGLMAAGVAAGDNVCLWLVNRPEHLFLLFAIEKIGAVLVPINTRFRTRDMAYVVKQSDATTLISAQAFGNSNYVAMIEEMLPDLRHQDRDCISMAGFPALRRVVLLDNPAVPGALCWEELMQAGNIVSDAELQERSAAVDPNGTALILYTSGTTGAPKGVMHSHNILRNVMDFSNRLGITPNDAALAYLPIYHVFGLWVALAAPTTGSRQVLMASFNASAALELIEAERITMIHGFDAHFKDLLEHPSRASRDLTSLRTGILAAGMRSTEPIARKAQQIVPTVTGYGMTEIGCGATLSFLDSDLETRTTMSGWPHYGYEFKIIDTATGASLTPGLVGEICIRGYELMQGYYRKPEEIAAVIDADGWLHSGDTGYMRADGCLCFLGRYKDMLKVGGENVDPMEVEGFLLEDPRINNVAIVGLQDERLGEVPVAFVIVEKDSAFTELDVLNACRGRIANFKIPRRVFVVEEFPMTGSGKIQKFLLREEAQRWVESEAQKQVTPS